MFLLMIPNHINILAVVHCLGKVVVLHTLVSKVDFFLELNVGCPRIQILFELFKTVLQLFKRLFNLRDPGR